MSGKFWKITGALILAVFTVALDKYWDTAFIQGIAKGILNLPDFMVAPVGVPFWIVIVVVLVLAVVVFKFVVSATERKLELTRPVRKQSDIAASLLLHPVTNEQKKILAFLAYAANTQAQVLTKTMLETMDLNRLVFDHALNQLLLNSLIELKRREDGNVIELTPQGKEYVINNKIPIERGAWMHAYRSS